MARGGASRPRFRLLPTVLLTVAILALPTVVYAWGRSSSSFAIHDIEVTGTKLSSHRTAVRLLRRGFLHRNLFTVTTADVRKALGPLCYVAGVSVDRDFPHTLKVRVAEHQPCAYVLSGQRWYVVSDGAYVVCTAGTPAAGGAKAGSGAGSGAGSVGASPSPSPSPTTTAGAEESSASGDKTSSGRVSILSTLQAGPPHARFELPRIAATAPLTTGSLVADRQVRAALPVIVDLPAKLRRDLAVLQSGAGGQLTLWFEGGPKVVWGDARRSVAKALALQAVLASYSAAGKKCTFVDVSTPETTLARPILK